VVRYGAPIQILTDQGRNFDGALFREFCQLLDIDKVRTSSYHPSGNGLIERFHRTLNTMLGKVVSDHQKDWDEFLPFVMAAYRASPHEVTGYTPNFLMFGRETRAPLDLVYGKPAYRSDRVENYGDFAQNLEETLETAYRLVRGHLQKAAERQKHSYDLRLRPAVFNEGAQVLYYTPRRYRGRSPKWQRMYTGPFVVLKRYGLVNYLIRKKSGGRPFVVHADKLRPHDDEDQYLPSKNVLPHRYEGINRQPARENKTKTNEEVYPLPGDGNQRPKRKTCRHARFL